MENVARSEIIIQMTLNFFLCFPIITIMISYVAKD